MASEAPPKQEPPYGLRMPPDLKERVKAAAKANNRSMNAEIVAALENAFPRPKTALDVVYEVAMVLGQVEPKLREEAIEALVSQAMHGRLARWAEASAIMEKEQTSRFPWEDD